MAHWQQIQFINEIKGNFPEFFSGTRVIEIGSLDVNGTVRGMFNAIEYVGIDVAEGPGVDVVCQAQNFAVPRRLFDMAISCEVMEHNPYWRESFLRMAEVVRPGGAIVLTCATHGRPEHGTSRTAPESSPLTVGMGWDYYRNLGKAEFDALPLSDLFSLYAFFFTWDSGDLYFVGIRGGGSAPRQARTRLLKLRLKYLARNILRPGAIAGHFHGWLERRGRAT